MKRRTDEYISILVQKHFCDFQIAGARDQCRAVMSTVGIDFSTSFEQKTNDLWISESAGCVQGETASAVRGVLIHFGAMILQQYS